MLSKNELKAIGIFAGIVGTVATGFQPLVIFLLVGLIILFWRY